MQGLSIQSLKKHKALIPLYACTALGCAGAVLYLARLAFRSPDVSWNKKTNPEPWQEYRNKQYKVNQQPNDVLCCVSQLIPLYACTALGCAGAVLYLARLAFRSPDVSWNKKTNPEPWQEYRNKQYKFYSPNIDCKESPAPKF